MFDFKQWMPGTRPEICPLSPKIDLGTRPAKVLKEALAKFRIKNWAKSYDFEIEEFYKPRK